MIRRTKPFDNLGILLDLMIIIVQYFKTSPVVHRCLPYLLQTKDTLMKATLMKDTLMKHSDSVQFTDVVHILFIFYNI